MKKGLFLSVIIITALVFTIMNVNANRTPPKKSITTSWSSFKGNIGPYKVEFNLEYGIGMNGPWEMLSYRYTSIRVNRGNWIDCSYAGESNGYKIWKEYINGRNTGTFRIVYEYSSYIRGTFTNSKGQRYNVSARYTGGNF